MPVKAAYNTRVFKIPVLTLWLLTTGQSRLVNTWGIKLNNIYVFLKNVVQSCCSHDFRTQNYSYTGTGTLIVIPSAFWKLPNCTATNVFIDDNRLKITKEEVPTIKEQLFSYVSIRSGYSLLFLNPVSYTCEPN